MKTIALALATLLIGCFVPRDHTTMRVVGSNVTVVPMPIAVTAQARNNTIRLTVTPQMCQRNQIEKVELTHSKRVEFQQPQTEGLIIYVLLLPITLPVSAVTLPASAIVSGISVRKHADRITHYNRTTPDGIEPCPSLVSGTIQLTLPSGAVTQAVTAPDGTTAFELPPDEPDHGIVSARADRSVAQVVYYRNHEVCEAHRKALLERANAASSGRAQLLRWIPRCAAMTTGTDPARERAWELATQAAIGAASGNCRPAFENKAELKELDRALQAAIYGHEEIVGCFARAAERSRQLSQCQFASGEAVRAAMRIQHLGRRGEALRRIPACKTEP